MPELYIGLMSGTSLDAIDVVIADFSPPAPTLLHTATVLFDSALRNDCLAFIDSAGQGNVSQLGELDLALGKAFAAATMESIRASGIDSESVTAIGSHGQTVLHKPDGQQPFTLQLGDPNQIAALTGITTVADFRRRDMAAGGQGAPLAPAFHNAVFRDRAGDRVVVNIGGMANITVLPSSSDAPVTGFDTGPGNVLLDSWFRQHNETAFDRNGDWSAQGTVNRALLADLLEEKFFRLAPPKSTGRELFNITWLEKRLSKINAGVATQDVQATLCELTATTISNAILEYAPGSQRVLVCGGGSHNTDLMSRLQNHLGKAVVEPTDVHGIPADWVEAMAFAWLAKQTMEGKPGNLPGVTGAERAVILGGIYPSTRS